MHQCPDRGPARRRERGRGQARSLIGSGDGGAGFDVREEGGRGRGPRRNLQGGRFRVAQRRLLDVPGHEPRHPCSRRALRLDEQPQLRGPAGLGRPDASHEPADGGGGGHHRPHRRRARAALMEPVSKVAGRMAPLDLADVDTDQIIPKQFLKRIERTGYGPFLFYDWRAKGDFVLDKPEHKGASVLATGENFGCGSSREHAPWAIKDAGYHAIIAPSFADIFRANCYKTGILAVTLPDLS